MSNHRALQGVANTPNLHIRHDSWKDRSLFGHARGKATYEREQTRVLRLLVTCRYFAFGLCDTDRPLTSSRSSVPAEPSDTSSCIQHEGFEVTDMPSLQATRSQIGKHALRITSPDGRHHIKFWRQLQAGMWAPRDWGVRSWSI